MPLWAGATVCDASSTNKGTLVGTVDVTYIGTTVTVEYKLSANYKMSEAHVNIGCEPYPTMV